MATKLSSKVVREVESKDGRTFIVTLSPEGLYMREKRRRGDFGPLDYGYLYLKAGTLAAVEKMTEKRSRPKKVSRGLLSTSDTLTR